MHYSTAEELFDDLRTRFTNLASEHNLLDENIEIHANVLTPKEAIGNPGRKDYPILEGKELMLQASYKGSKGQVFTSTPSSFTGTIGEVLCMDIVHDNHARSLFTAVMNAVMKHLSLAEGTIHCKNDGMEICAKKMRDDLKKRYENPKITLIGYQPALIGALAPHFEMRVLDLNPQNTGSIKDGITIEDGSDFENALSWGDLILSTGSTLVNGTVINFLNAGKDVIFYGTTIAGAASLLGLKRLCFESE